MSMNLTPAEQKFVQDAMLKVATETFEALKQALLKAHPDAGLRFSGQPKTGLVDLHVFCKPEFLPSLKLECGAWEDVISYPEVRIQVKEGT